MKPETRSCKTSLELAVVRFACASTFVKGCGLTASDRRRHPNLSSSTVPQPLPAINSTVAHDTQTALLLCWFAFFSLVRFLAVCLLFWFALQMSVEQMAKATRGLPEFQELSKKMAQHVRLSQECMDKVRTTRERYSIYKVHSPIHTAILLTHTSLHTTVVEPFGARPELA